MRLMKMFLAEFFSLAMIAGVLFMAWSMRVVKLSEIEGERVFYLHSASSQAEQTSTLSVRDYPKVKGESVIFALNGANEETKLQEILSRYRARVLFTEEVCGTRSYYCHTDEWNNAIAIGGYAVNLHIAISNERCAVGTPMIFGGF